MDALCFYVAQTGPFNSRGESNLIQPFLENREEAALLQEWVSELFQAEVSRQLNQAWKMQITSCSKHVPNL